MKNDKKIKIIKCYLEKQDCDKYDPYFGWSAQFFGHLDPRQNFGNRHVSITDQDRLSCICKAVIEAMKIEEE